MTDLECISQMFFNNSIITVFGGTGSIGRALVIELLKDEPELIQIISNDENSLWESTQFFSKNKNISHSLIDIRDYNSVDRMLLLSEYVFNCAAIKHVPIAEKAPIEAVQTNIFGLNNILLSCQINLVSKMIHISTDKVVEPNSVMGATKLIAERLCLNKRWTFPVSIIRFGNVYGSRGSLVPIVELCLNNGRKIPVTDSRMKRWFIRLNKAAKCIKECMCIMNGGEIFIPKMEEVKIIDVINDIIKESGIPPAEVSFKYIGIRPGEKLVEKIMTNEEQNRCKLKNEVYIIK